MSDYDYDSVTKQPARLRQRDLRHPGRFLTLSQIP